MADKANEKATEAKAEPTETGYHVYRGTNLLAGPYLTEEDAQAFVDGHADGDGEVRFVEVTAND